MAAPPAMPAVPQHPDGQAVWDAERVRWVRVLHGGLTDQQRGDDLIQVVGMAAAALPANNMEAPQQMPAQMQAFVQQVQAGQAQILAQLAQLQAGQAQLQAGLAQVQAGQAQLQVQQQNVRRRSHNAHALHQELAVQLLPLFKEQPLPEGAAVAGAAAVGSLPPANNFPATWAAAEELTNAQLNLLADFYGEQFGNANAGGAALAARRRAFRIFITQ